MLKQKEPVPPRTFTAGVNGKSRRHEFFEISIFKIEDFVKKNNVSEKPGVFPKRD